MSQVWEYIKIALMNIKSNKGRSILTMLGIIIGISSVITIISIGNGMKKSINDELNSFAGGQIYIYTSGQTKDGEYIWFTKEDTEMIRENIDHVKAVTPMEYYGGNVSGRGKDYRVTLKMGNEGIRYDAETPIISGRYFDSNDYYSGNKVCVIDEASAKLLFGSTNVVGMPVVVSLGNREIELTIVGVEESSAMMAVLGGTADSVTLEAPLTLLEKVFGEEWTFSEVLIICDGIEYSKEVAKQSVTMMEYKYDVRGENCIQLQNFADSMSQVNTILNGITAFIVLVAAISLLVGGIGVMNIMLVSVTERTREIGIRKALGARTGSILLQFLSESAIITLLGGIIGILLGVGLGVIVSAAMQITPYISLGTIVGASVFSSAVGIFFGIYPARKAAKLSPIEALRHE